MIKAPISLQDLRQGLYLRIPAKEIVCSDLMPIIYRAQRSRQFHVERLIDISQENG